MSVDLIAQYERNIRRYESAVAAQRDVIRCKNSLEWLQFATQALTAMEEGLTDCREDYLDALRERVRQLRLNLLSMYADRGSLLLKAKALTADAFRQVLVEFDIVLADAQQYIALHQRWDEFCRAERWANAAWHLPPDNVTDALKLVIQWRHEGQPDIRS